MTALISQGAAWSAGGLFLLMVLVLLRRPLLWLCKTALRSAIGLGVLALLAQGEGILGIQLGVNLVNALVLGVLGVPGFGLLLMVQWMLK